MNAPNGKEARSESINPGNWTGKTIQIHTTHWSETDDLEVDEMYFNIYDYWVRVTRKKYDLTEGDGPALVWMQFEAHLEDEETPSVVATQELSGNGYSYAYQKELGESGIVRDHIDPITAIAQVYANII
jgi:hypothetical protein